MNTNGVLFYAPTQALRYPEAHNLLDAMKPAVFAFGPSHLLAAVILDFKDVEYLDFTGIQTLFAIKDFLAMHTGRHIPLHFVNMRQSHMNRLIRVASYCPGSVSPPIPETLPSLTHTAYSPIGSPVMESPEIPPPLRRSRSTSLSKRTTQNEPFTTPMGLGIRASQASLVRKPDSIRRTRSNSSSGSNPAGMPGSAERRDSSSTSTLLPPLHEVEKAGVRNTAIGSFLQKMKLRIRTKSMSSNYSDSKRDTEVNPFGGSTVGLPEHLKRNVSDPDMEFGVDAATLSHFPSAFAQGIKYFHASLEEAVDAAAASNFS
ncbi:hypothetical protein HDU98_002562 [Podochytrium sp. JEL0797]|nr:hypothetical protein HDU98_002562 [Podochytrium sp. JEL0797]